MYVVWTGNTCPHYKTKEMPLLWRIIMITFVCFVLWYMGAPWWVYVLAIIGLIMELSE